MSLPQPSQPSLVQPGTEPAPLTPSIYVALWFLLTLAELGWSGPGVLLLSPLTALALLAGNSYSRRPRRWIVLLKNTLILLAALLCVLMLFGGRLLTGMMLLIQLALIALCMTLTQRREVFILLLASVGLMLYALGYRSGLSVRLLLPLYLIAAVLVLMQLQSSKVRAGMRQQDSRGGLLALVPVVLAVALLSWLLYWLIPQPPAAHLALVEQAGPVAYDDAEWQAQARQQAGNGEQTGNGSGKGSGQGSGQASGKGAAGRGSASSAAQGQGQRQNPGRGSGYGGGGAGNGDAGLSREPLVGLQGDSQQPPRLLLRVESEQPVWLRTFIFDHFNGESWARSQGADHYYWLRQQQFERPPASSDPVLYQRIEVLAPMEGVLPLTPVAHRLQLPSQVLRSDHLGALYLPGRLQPGLVYEVESTASRLDGRLLHAADYELLQATGAGYLQLPDSAYTLCPRAAELAQGREPMAAANALEEYLIREVATLSREQAAQAAPVTLESALQSGQMTAVQKLSSFLLMMRCLGTPTRLASGYRSDRQHPLTGAYEVGSDDAVVWGEVGLPALGWVRFNVNDQWRAQPDPRWLERALAYVEWRLQRGDVGVAEWLMLQGAAAALRVAILLRNGIQQAPVLATLVGLLLLLGPVLLWRYRRPLGDRLLEWRLRQRLQRDPQQAAVHLFAALENWFARRGQPRYPQETARRYSRRLKIDNPWLEDLTPLLQAFEHSRYAAPGDAASAVADVPTRPTSQQALQFWRQFQRRARESGWNLR